MSEFEIRYSGPATDEGFDMKVIGESMVGFDSLIKDFREVCGIKGDIHVKTTAVSKGSVIVSGYLLIEVASHFISNHELFMEAVEYYDPVVFLQLSSFLSDIDNVEKSIEDFFRERQFLSNMLTGIIAGVVVGWMTRERQPDKMSARIEKLRQRGRFDKAMKPLAEEGYHEISFTAKRLDKQRVASVDDAGYIDLVSDDAQILPDYENGREFTADAIIRSLSSSRGERIGLRFYGPEFGKRIYPAFPDDGYTTASYRHLYNEDVRGRFQVYRKSLYKVPEFKILNLERKQFSLLESGESIR